MSFTYTQPAGWTYSGTFKLDGATLAGQSENSSESPNDAMLDITQTIDGGQAPTQSTFSDTNAGNSSGPELTLNLEAVVWNSSIGQAAFQSYLGDVQDSSHIASPEVGPSCTPMVTIGSSNQGYSSYDNPTLGQTINTNWLPSGLIYCSTVPITLSTFENLGVPGKDVQAALASVDSLTPVFEYGFSAGSDGCDVAITTSGRVMLNPADTSTNCGTIQVTKSAASNSSVTSNATNRHTILYSFAGHGVANVSIFPNPQDIGDKVAYEERNVKFPWRLSGSWYGTSQRVYSALIMGQGRGTVTCTIALDGKVLIVKTGSLMMDCEAGGS